LPCRKNVFTLQRKLNFVDYSLLKRKSTYKVVDMSTSLKDIAQKLNVSEKNISYAFAPQINVAGMSIAHISLPVNDIMSCKYAIMSGGGG
jgi:hypothetical protein